MVDLQQTYSKNLGASLVREYLFRTGLKCTLKCMDEELPRSEDSFNNRTLLARELKMEQLARKYKQPNCPEKSLLEIIVCVFLKEQKKNYVATVSKLISRNNLARVSFDKWSSICPLTNKFKNNVSVQKSQMLNISRIMWFYRQLSDRGVKIDLPTFVQLYCNCFKNEQNARETISNAELSVPLLSQGRCKNEDRDELEEWKGSKVEYDETVEETMQYNRSHPKKYPPVPSNSVLREKENVLLDSLNMSKYRASYDNRTRLGPNKENTFQHLKRSSSTSEMDQTTTTLPSCASPSFVPGPSHDSSRPSSTELKEKSKSINLLLEGHNDLETLMSNKTNSESSLSTRISKVCLQNEAEPVNCINNEVEKVENFNVDQSYSLSREPSSDNNELNSLSSEIYIDEEISISVASTNQSKSKDWENHKLDEEIEITSSEKNIIKRRNRPILLLPSEIKAVEKGEGLENFMRDESDSNVCIDYVPLKLSIAIAIKKLIIGSSIRSFSQQWMGQSFVFSANPKFRYGFVQNKGGSCGVLASVQGFLLKALLFDPNITNEVDPLRPTRQEVRKALVYALTELLWKAGGCKQAALVRSGQESHLQECLVYRPDCLTENLSWKRFFSEKDVHEAIEKHLEEFTSPLGKGCLRLIISAILSRGIQSVIGDMDDETAPLVGPGGACSLELVNLLITGRAVSNVFDNDLQLDSCLLKGISKRSEIGFLSIFEHFNSCQVGSNLKTPRYPIWLVNCENHFSVVFSSCKQLVSDWRAERQFHLYHYDGLVGQCDETVITVDTTGFSVDESIRKDDTPPLELCIKTKWKDAVIHCSSSSF